MTEENFSFDRFEINSQRTNIIFKYSYIKNGTYYSLQESLYFPAALPPDNTTNKLLKALHLALGLSYYKTFLQKNLIHPYKLSLNEVAFWNKIYGDGLGEFIFKNKLEFSDIAKFKIQDGISYDNDDALELANSALLGIGGGKDSIVAGEALLTAGLQIDGFMLTNGNNSGQADAVAKTMGIAMHKIIRTIDPAITKINDLEGALNGHIPISLIYALAGTTLSVALGKKYTVIANEASASLPQTSWRGVPINHQWSKSLEFETLYNNYVQKNICSSLHYFSAIRPLNSIAVARELSKYPKYYEVFTSDNSLLKLSPGKREHPRWSSQSSKSLSSYILMSPWLSKQDMKRIFGRDFLDDTKLETQLLALIGHSGEPILDCVGTPTELLASLEQTHRQKSHASSKLMIKLENLEVLGKESSTSLDELASNLAEHQIPANIADKLAFLRSIQ